MDFAIDPVTNDLLLDSKGNLVVLTGRDAIAQHVRIRLQFVLGEWFLDTREGMPWFEQIWIANPNVSAIKEAFRRTIAETPGIASVRSFDMSLDVATRTLTVTRAEVVTTDGSAITADDFRPFVIVDPAV